MNEKTKDSRSKKAKLNIIVSLVGQFVTLVCGMIIPSLMINTFGSEVYGATASISQFLAYITLIEGGIGGVARAALYGPLAKKDINEISAIISQIKRFFRVIAVVFAVYVLVLASSFKYVSDIQSLDWISTFLLVVVISVSTFAQYFIGISYSILLQADQKTYITRLISIAGTIMNTLMIVLFVNLKCDIIIVRLVSSCVFVMQPIAMWLYVRKHFKLVRSPKTEKDYLKQRWNALGQHIAWFLHSNTDVAILTVFAGLKNVAVYSVYNMVVSSIQAIVASFATGMEALFGDMLAKKENEKLNKTFNYYETMISLVTIILLATTAVLIIPFVQLYTASVDDQNYIAPLFALLLILSSVVYCLRQPYHSMVIAAGHFKQTQLAAYGEVVINVGLSLLLVSKFGLVGVAFGTLVASIFKWIYYVLYLSKNIINRNIGLFLKRIFVNALTFLVSFVSASWVIRVLSCENYFEWVISAVIAILCVALITFIVNFLCYAKEMRVLFSKLLHARK